MNFKLCSLISLLISVVLALKDFSKKVENNVYVATLSNYDSLVLDKSKDVFVMFYSPICPFSQKLLPTWEQLADRFKSQSNDIIFAKFDGSDVDVPDSSPWIELEEFPTMVLFKKTNIDKKSYVLYPIEGSRTLANLAKFIEHSSTNKNHIELTQEEINEVDNYDDVTPLDADDDEELDDDDVKAILNNMEVDDDEIKEDNDEQYVRISVDDDHKEKNDDSIPKTKNDEVPKTAASKDEL
ncbi:thioredoxin-like protein [Neocallimastix lanati (nom. inval.)]|jgi:thiol-disulfide isomerase/thioredoxin|uniref:Thioredoxin-like protein n=1 Tax=Neocallimastix californiae TaxID=1754190 RepID=A0A1Y2CFV4_9FUNG|nr:thioredoxin-like protein [Neocallimastix sp. JGI-2020a]ORY45806.1 thioredoxin-like protein [Neocallimastix californiae]|eukprot:ORY45806.1 thioredoxin-like protein [Neocallimastix californiae]